MESFISFENITKKYNEHVALDDVAFSIKKGRCVGLLGANGAGKTTTLKIISGLLKPSIGTILLEGKPIEPSSINFKRNIGFLSQHPKFYEWMTGNEFLSYVADLYGIPSSNKKKRIDEVLEIVDLTDTRKKRIRGYSGGMKQRLGIAQAILHNPIFLILDEPVSALDPEGRFQIIKLLQKLKQHTTILLSTHILHDADGLCDDVIMLHKGKKIIESELKQLKELHQEPIIKISCVDTTESIVPILEKYNWIENVKSNQAELLLRVSEKNIALERLPQILLEHNLPFDSFQLFEPSLEDIFLKLVSRL